MRNLRTLLTSGSVPLGIGRQLCGTDHVRCMCQNATRCCDLAVAGVNAREGL